MILAFCLWLNTAHVIRVYSTNMHMCVFLWVLVLTVWKSSFLSTECTWKHWCGHRRPVNEPGEMPSNKNLSVKSRQHPPTQRLRWGIQSSGENMMKEKRKENKRLKDSPLAVAIRAWSCSASVGGWGQGPVPIATSGPPVALWKEEL